MGISRTILSGGISNKEALTGVVLPKDFIKAPESVMQEFMPKPIIYSSSPLAPPAPPAQEPNDQAAAAKAAASTQASQKRNAFGVATLIGD